jgi:phospholipase/carboxylesterase
MTLVHRLRPADGDPQGALVLLHGRGADEHDLYGLLDVLDPQRRLLGLTPGAPMTGIPPGGRHWYLVPRVGFPDPDSFSATYAELTAFLDGMLADHGIPWERTVIGGFSMGAVMSYSTALGPGRPAPAALLAFSGFVPTVEGWEADFDGREQLPVFIHHGRQDPIIPVDFARQAAAMLQGAGLPVEYLETDAPHAIPPQAVERAWETVATALGGP